MVAVAWVQRNWSSTWKLPTTEWQVEILFETSRNGRPVHPNHLVEPPPQVEEAVVESFRLVHLKTKEHWARICHLVVMTESQRRISTQKRSEKSCGTVLVVAAVAAVSGAVCAVSHVLLFAPWESVVISMNLLENCSTF